MQTLKKTYDELTGEREGFLHQARLSSELTLPSLIPPDGTGNSYLNLYRPFQSLGAHGVNSLSNKLVLALFPPTEPFFRFRVESSEEELANTPEEVKAEIDSQLSILERTIFEEFSARNDRATMVEAMKHLVVGGNVLLHVGKEHTTFFDLDKYVVIRDGEGTVCKVVVKECLNYKTFAATYPELTDIHEAHKGARNYYPTTIEVYSCMTRDGESWVGYSEAKGKKISGTEFTAKLDKPPYIPIRFNKIDGQNYGRGYIEDMYGDLRSLDELSKAIVEGSAAAAKIVNLVNPNGLTSIRALSNAENGDYIPGNAADVTNTQLNKNNDFSVTATEIARIEQRLSKSLLLVDSIQRSGERVTAEEIKIMAQSLENVLGGVYTLLAEEFQRPYINRLVHVLQESGKILPIPSDKVKPTVVTGLSAIGRGIDGDRLLEFLTQMVNAVGQESLATYVNIPIVISKLASSRGIDPRGMIKSPQELQAEQEQAMQQQMMMQATPGAVKAMGDMAVNSMPTDEEQPIEQEA